MIFPAGTLGATATAATAADTPVVVTGGTSLPGRTATATGPGGVTFGLSGGTLNGSYPGNGSTIFNLPMYLVTSGDRAKFWDNYVEELVTSGVDFVAPVLRGYAPGSAVPNGGGDPRLLTELVDAINRRGVADRLKIAAFDDTPASMTDKKNLAVHKRGGYDPPFDIADADGTGEGGYKYIWDNNLRAFFTGVPDNLRFKIDGRPVVYEWSLSDSFFVNQGDGNSARMLQHVRDRAKAEFGVDPFFNLDRTWMERDPAVSTVANGSNAWFNMPNGGRSLITFNGRSYGVAVPGFYVVRDTTNMVIDPNHGQAFANNLNTTVNSGAAATLVEGFTDWEENAAVWRMAAGTYAERRVDYPNQMLNVLRRYSRNPFPTDMRVEAETADSYSDSTPSNAYGVYRAGDLDVQASLDTGGGWNVGSTSNGEWLQWQEIPLQNAVTLKARVSTPNTDAKLRFVIDGVAGPAVSVPNTGGWQNYQTIDAGAFSLVAGKHHTVRLEFLGGPLNINFWQALTQNPPAGENPPVGGNPLPTGPIALRAVINNKYVSASSAGAGNLIAGAAAIGVWEPFELVDLGGGNVALRAKINNMYVSAAEAGAKPLIANRAAVGGWETFTLVRNSDNTVSLRAKVNGRYVSAENYGADPLIANRDTISTWEKFTLTIL
ncbi:DUF5010 domain-containing protein [Micromonospora pisi]|nr:DUF5010 domain-containing protein [Micromonospora pisi]